MGKNTESLFKDIKVEFVDQKGQRYDTVGDYGETDEAVWFKITRLKGHPAYPLACLIHEVYEFFRNKQLGVTVEEVDAFDLGHPELDDPGLSGSAPYHVAHMEADCLERAVIRFMGGDWIEYEKAVSALFERE